MSRTPSPPWRVIAAAIGQLLFRLGARDRIDFLSFLNAYIILGLVFYAAGMVAWIYALSKEQMVTVCLAATIM